MPKMSAKLKRGHPNGGAKCWCGGLNAVAVAENWRCSTICVIQRVVRVCQLIFVCYSGLTLSLNFESMARLHGTFSVNNTGLQTHTHTYRHRQAGL